MSQPDRLSPSALGERLFALTEDLIAIADVHGRIQRVNPAWQISLGWTREELEGRSYLDFVHPADRDAFGAAAMRLSEDGERVSGAEARWRAADGGWRWLVWSARNENGIVYGIARPADTVRETDHKLQEIATHLREMLWLATPEHGAIDWVSPACRHVWGREPEELMSDPTLWIGDVHPGDRRRVLEALGAASDRPYEVQYRITRSGDGAVRWMRSSGRPIPVSGAGPARVAGITEDVTERLARDEELRLRDEELRIGSERLRASEEDARMAREHFESAFLHAPIGMGVLGRDGRWLAVNPALCQMTGFPEDALRGAHFDQLTPPAERAASAEQFAAIDGGEIRTLRIERPVVHANAHELWCVISASATRTGEDTLRSVVVQFEDVTERRRTEQRLRAQVEELAWVERIRGALEDDAFVLLAQPIVDARSGECVREELLIRMRLGSRLIEPAAFLGVAERHGVVEAIDAWVAGRAAALAAGGRPVQMNVSARSAGDERFLEALEQALETHGTPAGALTVELTETALADDMEQARRFASRLERLGVPLALDDFGVGWASLQYLKTLPGLRFLKIDSEFVRDLVSEERSRALVRAIVELARSFGHETIAEGVEDAETRDLLCALGVDCLQGYLLGRPAPI